MYVIYGKFDLFLPHCSSLKEKRKIIQSIIGKFRKRFNLSISEVAYHDLWQRTKLGFSAVSSKHSELLLFIDSIRDTLDNYEDSLSISTFTYEIINDK